MRTVLTNSQELRKNEDRIEILNAVNSGIAFLHRAKLDNESLSSIMFSAFERSEMCREGVKSKCCLPQAFKLGKELALSAIGHLDFDFIHSIPQLFALDQSSTYFTMKKKESDDI